MAERDAQGPSAQERCLGTQPRVLGQVADPAADLADPLRMAGEHGRLRGHQQAPGAQFRLRGQVRGAFQRRRGRRVPAPRTGALRAVRQGVGDLRLATLTLLLKELGDAGRDGRS
ncbi:hypothetical protein [Streptomyces sp. NPDC052107]|uniref:hypothetical protein n=1 Tax=Streptomyces sp. NPDC052107 TaxID=3155632 RepID=UPI00342F4162